MVHISPQLSQRVLNKPSAVATATYRVAYASSLQCTITRRWTYLRRVNMARGVPRLPLRDEPTDKRTTLSNSVVRSRIRLRRNSQLRQLESRYSVSQNILRRTCCERLRSKSLDIWNTHRRPFTIPSKKSSVFAAIGWLWYTVIALEMPSPRKRAVTAVL